MLSNTAEGGTDQTAVTTGNSGGASGDAFNDVNTAAGGLNQFDVAAKLNGSLGYKIANRSTAANTYVGWRETVHPTLTIGYGSYNITATATPTTSSATAQFFNGAGSVIVRIYWLTSNKIQLWQLSAFIASSLSTTVLTPGTFYRIEYRLEMSGATSTCTYRIFLGGTNILLEQIGPIVLTAATDTQYTRSWYGVHNAINLPTTTDFFYYDDLIAANSDWTTNIQTYAPTLIANPHVGPMALRFQMRERFSYWPQALIPSGGVVNPLTLTASDVVTTATMTRAITKALALIVTVVTSSTLVKQANKILAATSATTATLIKQVNKALTVTVATTKTLIRQVNKVLSATSATAATLATLKVILRTLTVTVATTPTMIRQVGKPLSATVTMTASLVKQIGKILTRTVATTATLATQKVKLVALIATVATTATVTRQIQKLLSVTSAITATLQVVSSAITAFFSKAFDATIGHPRTKTTPDDADWQSGPHGNIDSSPHDQSFD